MNKFVIFIRSERAKHLSTLIGFLGVLLPTIIIVVAKLVFPTNSRIFNVFTGVAIIVLFSLSGLLSTVYITRKEINTLFTVRGKTAQFLGLIFLILSLGLLIWAVFRIVTIL